MPPYLEVLLSFLLMRHFFLFLASSSFTSLRYSWGKEGQRDVTLYSVDPEYSFDPEQEMLMEFAKRDLRLRLLGKGDEFFTLPDTWNNMDEEQKEEMITQHIDQERLRSVYHQPLIGVRLIKVLGIDHRFGSYDR